MQLLRKGTAIMETIKSFTVNHIDLLPGLYVSRQDKVGEEIVTTFDMRVMRPNVEPVMDTGAIHTLEHLFATYLRNDAKWKERVIYLGPMGCRTGFYIILAGDLKPLDIKDLVSGMVDFAAEFEGDIPGVSARECGNYCDHNLLVAKYYANKYKNEVLSDFTEERYIYPR